VLMLCLKGKTRFLYAHRASLLTRAPELAVICEAFDGGNPMPLPDIEPDIFKLMLKLVSGRNTQHQFSIGKYGLSCLKEEAEVWHVKHLKLTFDNVIDHFLKVDGYNFSLVKNTALKFIVENSEVVIASESYHLAMTKHISQNKRRKTDE
jgi:hypothetical protein